MYTCVEEAEKTELLSFIGKVIKMKGTVCGVSQLRQYRLLLTTDILKRSPVFVSTVFLKGDGNRFLQNAVLSRKCQNVLTFNQLPRFSLSLRQINTRLIVSFADFERLIYGQREFIPEHGNV